MAADNAVALDAVIARMMGLDPAMLGFMQKARETGLGDFDEGGIEIIGQLTPIPDFKVPPLGGEATMENAAIQEFLSGRIRLRRTARGIELWFGH